MLQRLFTPGPVPVPAPVMEACAAQPLYHHSGAFRDVAVRVWTSLQSVYRTTDPVLVMAGHAMTGIEAAVASTLRPTDGVVVLNNGRFAERCVTILRRYGCEVHEIKAAWGQSISADDVGSALERAGTVRAVWMVHSETSTGVTIDLQAIAATIRTHAPHALICVDAVTSMAVHRVETAAWDLDVVVTGVQKGLLCPPGLACISLSQRAQHALHTDSPRSYVLDLQNILRLYRTEHFFATPPVTIVAGLDVALQMILTTGLEATWDKHQRVADMVRHRMRTLGLQLFGEHSSNALVPVVHERAEEIRSRLEREHGIIVAGGQDQLHGSIIRIGTCGPYTEADMEVCCTAIASVLKDL